MLRTTFALATTFSLMACTPTEYTAEVSIGRNAKVSMSVTALFGLHSDWTRSIKVSDGKVTVSRDLLEDTGWWRGSHLYLHASGTYVVHEGQAGCFGFSLEPTTFDVRTAISCTKKPSVAARLSADTPEHNGYPASKYYVGLFYIGRFIETYTVPESQERRTETAIIFQTHQQQAEQELPEIM